MKYNEIVKPGLTFTTPSGKEGRVIGVEKDRTIAPIWKNRQQRFGWIVTARIGEDLVNLLFGTDDNLKKVKFNTEPEEKWRTRL